MRARIAKSVSVFSPSFIKLNMYDYMFDRRDQCPKDAENDCVATLSSTSSTIYELAKFDHMMILQVSRRR